MPSPSQTALQVIDQELAAAHDAETTRLLIAVRRRIAGGEDYAAVITAERAAVAGTLRESLLIRIQNRTANALV